MQCASASYTAHYRSLSWIRNMAVARTPASIRIRACYLLSALTATNKWQNQTSLNSMSRGVQSIRDVLPLLLRSLACFNASRPIRDSTEPAKCLEFHLADGHHAHSNSVSDAERTTRQILDCIINLILHSNAVPNDGRLKRWSLSMATVVPRRSDACAESLTNHVDQSR